MFTQYLLLIEGLECLLMTTPSLTLCGAVLSPDIKSAARMFLNLCLVCPGVFIQLLDLKLITKYSYQLYTRV